MKILITALCTAAALSLAPAAQADGNSANLDALVGQA